ncbi:MAG: single-stranded DNA-binding protein [Bacteroidales bacterium]
MSVNKVILVGNVGKDPETRYLDDSTAISKFPMATSETYKNRSGERVSTTEWHNIVLWRGLAQVAEKYVKKGTQLYIEGRIKTRSYDDSDGNKKYITEIVGDQMQLLGRRPDEGEDEGGYGGSQSAAGGSASASATSGGTSGTATGGQAAPNRSDSSSTQLSSGDGGNEEPFDSGDDGPDDLPF